MIVSAGKRHDLADAQHRPRFGRSALVFGRIVDGAGGDDGALAGHQARAGAHGADRARIGQRNGGVLEIGGRQLAFAGAVHQVVEGRDILREIQRAGVLDVGDQQVAIAILGRHVHRDAQVNARMHDASRLAVGLAIGMVQAREIFQGFENSPADQVRVGDFALADQRAVLVDDAAIFVHHLDGNDALRGGQRDGHAGVHVLGDFRGDAAQGLEVGGRGCRRRGDMETRGRGDFRRDGFRVSIGRVFEDVLPAFVHCGAVVQILLV